MVGPELVSRPGRFHQPMLAFPKVLEDLAPRGVCQRGEDIVLLSLMNSI